MALLQLRPIAAFLEPPPEISSPAAVCFAQEKKPRARQLRDSGRMRSLRSAPSAVDQLFSDQRMRNSQQAITIARAPNAVTRAAIMPSR
jgi:hypothetical protein